MDTLFYDVQGRAYSAYDVKSCLLDIGAADCECLFIHSDIMFGHPGTGFKKKEYLNILYEIFMELKINNLIVPTFTYSFPNHEDFDLLNSKTSMGAFSEYVRKIEGRYRTDDPLLSVSVPKSLEPKFNHISNHSLGEGSAMDLLHHLKNVKFLFFGAEMAECFTYVHYIEKMMDVPYRFDIAFQGNVIYPDGRMKIKKQIIHTQCHGVKLPLKYDYFEKELEDKGYLKKKRLADKYVACLSEEDAYREIRHHIQSDIYYFLEEPFDESKLVYQYTYNTEKERITHC